DSATSTASRDSNDTFFNRLDTAFSLLWYLLILSVMEPAVYEIRFFHPVGFMLCDLPRVRLTNTRRARSRSGKVLMSSHDAKYSSRLCGVCSHTYASASRLSRKTRQKIMRSPSRSLTVSIGDGSFASSTASDPANGST